MKTSFDTAHIDPAPIAPLPLRLTRRAVLVGAGALLAERVAHAELPVSSRELWGWVRAQQVIEPQLTYLDTATFGPALRSAMVAEYRDQEILNSDAESYRRARFSAQAITALADKLATLINADTREVTITRGATEALNIIANGIDLQAGDEVILTTHVHPAALAPWQLRATRAGIIIKPVALPSPLEDGAQPMGLIASAVTDRTRVIVCSHVQHTDGAVIPVKDICTFARQRNILTVIDGAQAVGCIDVDAHGIDCDFYAGSLHKWFNGPAAMGLLYVRHDRIDNLWPLLANASLGAKADELSGSEIDEVSEQRHRWPLTWRKFGWDTRSWGPQLKALEAAFEFRTMLSAERIESRIRELAIYARLRLQALNEVAILTPPQPGLWAGLLVFRTKRGSAIELAQRLTRNERIVVSAIQHPALQGGALRASFHIYNSHDDIDRLVRGVQKYT